MTNLTNVFSLEGLAFTQGLEGGYDILTLGTGQGKTSKGIAWGVETSVKNSLKGFVFVTSEVRHVSLKEAYKKYIEFGKLGIEANNLEFIIITTYDGETDTEVLIDRLNYIKGQQDYCLVLDDVQLDDRTPVAKILEELEKHGGNFNKVLVTKQAPLRRFQ